MFKQPTTDNQQDFFGSFDFNLDEQRIKVLNDPNSWFNQFFNNVTKQLAENHFSVLYHQHMGRSNAPIRILLAMMALKSGFGWSDAQLYEQVHFNLQVMKALGFVKLSDKAPAASTYYLFKQAVYQYHIDHGRDLIDEAFKKLTKAQLEIMGVDGSMIRMDSKLIGSNIIRCSRLQLIISCLQSFWKSLSKEAKTKLKETDHSLLNALSEKKPNNIVYPLSEDEKSQKLIELGHLLYRLQQSYDDSDSTKYFLIKRILDEQYQVEQDDKITLKPAKEISASSIQSAHDPDAAYRRKDTQTVTGYSVNVTETCNKTGLNLVTDIQVEPATKADKDYVQPALDNTAEISDPINEAYMDGAYQSSDNRDYGETNEIQLYYTGISGSKGTFEFKKTETGLEVTNRKTGETVNATEYKDNHYKIKLSSGKWRYFKPDEIDCYERRRAIECMPKEIKNRRNNVEATIFQLCFHTRNNKTRYRGQFQNKVWALSRAMWMNLVRIKNYVKNSNKAQEVALG